ncbi:MAG TPA: hypothetical protein VIF57_32470 [Polyangia bacterium]|jgi:hypothetical protein
MNGKPGLILTSLTLAASAAGAAGCMAGPQTVAVQRASNEFSCPADRIAVVQRGDISDSVYDVAACGRRARYSCFWIDADSVAASARCVREPDPPRSDPDPMALASLPRPPSAAEPYGSGNVIRICGRDDGACFEPAGGSWRWRPGRAEQTHCGGASCW